MKERRNLHHRSFLFSASFPPYLCNRQSDIIYLMSSLKYLLFNFLSGTDTLCVNTKSHTDDGQTNDRLFYFPMEESFERGRSVNGLRQKPSEKGVDLR